MRSVVIFEQPKDLADLLPADAHEEVVAPAGQSPALPEGATLPMRLFNLRDHNSDFDRIILLEE